MDTIKDKVFKLTERVCEISSMFCVVTTALRDNDGDSAPPAFKKALPAALELLQREVDSLWTGLGELEVMLNNK